jgi:hypothetical protein
MEVMEHPEERERERERGSERDIGLGVVRLIERERAKDPSGQAEDNNMKVMDHP